MFLIKYIVEQTNPASRAQGGKIEGSEHYVSTNPCVFSFSIRVDSDDAVEMARQFESKEEAEKFMQSELYLNRIKDIILNYVSDESKIKIVEV